MYELAHRITIGRNGRNLRLVNFLLVGVNTLALVNGYIVVVEIAVGEIYNLLLGHAFNTLLALDNLLPRRAVDKRIDKHIDTFFIIFKSIVVLQLQIVDDRRKKVVAELTLL